MISSFCCILSIHLVFQNKFHSQNDIGLELRGQILDFFENEGMNKTKKINGTKGVFGIHAVTKLPIVTLGLF